jgi:hypothetical protein
MVLCIHSCAGVVYAPVNGLSCASASARMQPTLGPVCQHCLAEHGCADIPGKVLLHVAPAGLTPPRPQAVRGLPYLLAVASLRPAAEGLSGVLFERSHDGHCGMLSRLLSHGSVVLRL